MVAAPQAGPGQAEVVAPTAEILTEPTADDADAETQPAPAAGSQTSMDL
jgi:hypothetical protein